MIKKAIFGALLASAIAATPAAAEPDYAASIKADYDKSLEQSMVGETTAFFREVLQRGLTLREFLHSDWTMVNARLAEFYGISRNALASGFRGNRGLAPCG